MRVRLPRDGTRGRQCDSLRKETPRALRREQMGGRGREGGVEGKSVGRRCGAEGRAGNQYGTTQSRAAVARGAAHGLSRPQQPAVRKGGAKKARARKAPDCPGSPTSDQKRALGRSRNLQSSPTVRMDDFQSLQDICASLLRPSWQASADLHVSWNTATTGQYDLTGYGDIGWRPNSLLVSFLVG